MKTGRCWRCRSVQVGLAALALAFLDRRFKARTSVDDQAIEVKAKEREDPVQCPIVEGGLLPASSGLSVRRKASLAHRLWLERPASLSGVPRWMMVGAIGLAVWLVGFLTAVVLGIHTEYLGSPAFAVGAFGSGWVLGSIRERARGVDVIYESVAQAFGRETADFERVVDLGFKTISKTTGHLWFASVFFAAAAVAVVLAFYHHPIVLFGESQDSLRPWIFAREIYSPDAKRAGAILVVLFAVPVSLTLGTTYWLLYQELRLIVSLRDLVALPLADAVRTQLRPLADFHATVASDWFVGALLFFVAFVTTPDYVAAAVVATLLITGAAVFLFPQLVLGRLIRAAHERACAITLKEWSRLASGDTRSQLTMLATSASATAPPSYWIYSSGELIRWSVAQIIGTLAVVTQLGLFS